MPYKDPEKQREYKRLQQEYRRERRKTDPAFAAAERSRGRYYRYRKKENVSMSLHNSRYARLCKDPKFRAEHNEYVKTYYAENAPSRREAQNRRNWWTRHGIIEHYSNGMMACANPYGEHDKPYITYEALTIDHITGNGAEMRKQWKFRGNDFTRWLVKNNYPEGYQVLCMNCQFIKRVRNHEAHGRDITIGKSINTPTRNIRILPVSTSHKDDFTPMIAVMTDSTI